jgi:hypothetical protein
MRDVIILGVKAQMRSGVRDILELLHYTIPWGAAHILKNDYLRPMLFDPRKHASEGTPWLSVGINILLLVVESWIVDAWSTSN